LCPCPKEEEKEKGERDNDKWVLFVILSKIDLGAQI
jgi:hypothetical protein